MAQQPIWDEQCSFTSSGSTPFGFLITMVSFKQKLINLLRGVQKIRLSNYGCRITRHSILFCFEESISEYSAQVNQFNIKDNLLNLTRTTNKF